MSNEKKKFFQCANFHGGSVRSEFLPDIEENVHKSHTSRLELIVSISISAGFKAIRYFQFFYLNFSKYFRHFKWGETSKVEVIFVELGSVPNKTKSLQVEAM